MKNPPGGHSTPTYNDRYTNFGRENSYKILKAQMRLSVSVVFWRDRAQKRFHNKGHKMTSLKNPRYCNWVGCEEFKPMFNFHTL